MYVYMPAAVIGMITCMQHPQVEATAVKASNGSNTISCIYRTTRDILTQLSVSHPDTGVIHVHHACHASHTQLGPVWLPGQS
jgi:hypothetical protein